MKRREFIKQLIDKIIQARYAAVAGHTNRIIYSLKDEEFKIQSCNIDFEEEKAIELCMTIAITKGIIDYDFNGNANNYVDGYKKWKTPEERAVELYNEYKFVLDFFLE